MIVDYLKHLGPLRIFLGLAAVVAILLRPAPGAEVVYEGWAVVSTLLLPVLAPLLFLLLMLDALMTKVILGADAQQRDKYRHILWTDLLVGLAVLLYWLPYFITINQL